MSDSEWSSWLEPIDLNDEEFEGIAEPFIPLFIDSNKVFIEDGEHIEGKIDALRSDLGAVRVSERDSDEKLEFSKIDPLHPEYNEIVVLRHGGEYDFDIDAFPLAVEPFESKNDMGEHLDYYLDGFARNGRPPSLPKIRNTDEGLQIVDGHTTIEAARISAGIKEPQEDREIYDTLANDLPSHVTAELKEYESQWDAALDFVNGHIPYRENLDILEEDVEISDGFISTGWYDEKRARKSAEKALELFGNQAVLLERLGAYVHDYLESQEDSEEEDGRYSLQSTGDGSIRKGKYELQIVEDDQLTAAAAYIAGRMQFGGETLPGGYDREEGKNALVESFETLDDDSADYSILDDIKSDADSMDYVPEDIRDVVDEQARQLGGNQNHELRRG